MTNVLFEMTNQICLGRLKKSNLICKNQIYFCEGKKKEILSRKSYLFFGNIKNKIKIKRERERERESERERDFICFFFFFVKLQKNEI